MKRRSLGLVITGALVAAASIAASCATGPEPTGSQASGGTAADASSAGGSSAAAGTGTNAGGTSSGGTSSSSGGTSGGGTSGVVDATPWLDAPDVDFLYEANAPSVFDPDASCVATVVRAVATPLDLYIMLDQSESMLGKTTSGLTKWDAVKQALSGFINSAQSDGIGVGIQYFPLRKAGVPAVCTSDADCGTSGGRCVLKVCSNSTPQGFQLCTQDADCRPFACVQLGECQDDQSYICVNVGGSCGTTLGACVAKPAFCTMQDSCDVPQYSTPAVPIALLPGNASALINSINAQAPFGLTPTAPALQGAIDYAKTYARINPSHTVAVVLATDGLPTECSPTQINQVASIAATGLNGSPSIKTFVIGVFASTDTNAQSNLNTIATGGGTAPAYMVNAGGNVAQGFIDALNQIRGKTLGCEFQMPVPEAGIVDPTEVQVQYTPTSGTTTVVPNVSGVGSCTADQWYYDNNTSPTKLILCPSLCTKVKAEADPKVDISLGCLGT